MSAARVAAVPLLALAGVTACESEDKPAARTAQSPSSKGDGKDDKGDEQKGEFRGTEPEIVPTNEQTADVMLTAEEAPRGYKAGPVNKLFASWNDNYRVAPEKCAGVIDDSLTRDLVGSARFFREKGTAEDGVMVRVFGGDRVDLAKRLDDFATTVEGCTSFQESNGTGTWDYQVSDVRRGTYGPGSVSYRFTHVEDSYVVHNYRVLTVDGTVVTDVSSEAEAKSGKPDEPTGFVQAQRDKIGLMEWTAAVPTPGVSTKQPAP